MTSEKKLRLVGKLLSQARDLVKDLADVEEEVKTETDINDEDKD